MAKSIKTLCSIGALATTIVCAGAPSAHAADPAAANIEDLYSLPVEQLAGLDYIVTSAAKKEEKVLDTAAAIFVISQEDIRRSGATSVPEVLRMAPGVDVARIDASRWAISIRGFNAQFGNKLLVLIDGRSVYNPFFSGVYWDEQDVMLEDVDRIEIIRGPGAALYGANAVNGVINIITKTARDTQGNLATAGGGTLDRGFGSVRHGGQEGDLSYRAYAKYDDTRDKEKVAGIDSSFDWSTVRSGFRADWGHQEPDAFTVQGDLYQNRADVPQFNSNFISPFMHLFDEKNDPDGANVIARWSHAFSGQSKMEWQNYIDYDNRKTGISDIRTTSYDTQMQHDYSGFSHQDLVWGFGGRLIQGYASALYVTKASSTTHILNAFVQDEIALIPNRWTLTLGSKFEHNSYTGVEVQPSVRTLWKLDDRQSVWAAVSRAVRTPSRFENELSFVNTITDIPPVTLVQILGDKNLGSEELIAYETGYRAQVDKDVNVDAAFFYNDYSRLIGPAIGDATSSGVPIFHVISPLSLTADSSGETYGLELTSSWNVTEQWQLKGSYRLIEIALHTDAGDNDPTAEAGEHQSPQNQFSIISHLSLPCRTEFDTALYYVDSLSSYHIPGYVRADLRLGWKALDNLELSLVGQNLFDNSHIEFQSEDSAVQVPIPRSLIGQATWRF